MFHRILPEKLITSPNAYSDFGTLISQEYFEQVLLLLIENDYQFATISNLETYNDKTIALTFDDGYSDNFEYVLPILQKYNLTATFYPIVNPCINNSVLPLDTYYQCVDNIQLSEQQRYDYTKGETKKRFYWSEPTEQRKLLQQLFPELPQQNRVKYMSPEQIKILAYLGFEIGSHSLTHSLFIADYMNRSKIDFELQESKRILETTIGKSITSFCFPSGYYNYEIIEQAKNAGYTSVCVIDKNSENEVNVLPTYERFFVKPNSIRELLKQLKEK